MPESPIQKLRDAISRIPETLPHESYEEDRYKEKVKYENKHTFDDRISNYDKVTAMFYEEGSYKYDRVNVLEERGQFNQARIFKDKRKKMGPGYAEHYFKQLKKERDDRRKIREQKELDSLKKKLSEESNGSNVYE